MNVEQLEIEVRKLVPEDGDVLVFKTKEQLTMAERGRLWGIFEGLQTRIQKRIDLIVLENGAELEVLKTSRLADLYPDGKRAA